MGVPVDNTLTTRACGTARKTEPRDVIGRVAFALALAVFGFAILETLVSFARAATR